MTPELHVREMCLARVFFLWLPTATREIRVLPLDETDSNARPELLKAENPTLNSPELKELKDLQVDLYRVRACSRSIR